MRKIMLVALPYSILCLVTLLLGIIWWPSEGGLVQLTNSLIALFFICSFCAIFLFQEEIYHFLDKHIENIFSPSRPKQKHRDLPAIFKDNQKFQEIISGTVMDWMENVNIQKEEKKLNEGDLPQAIEQYKKARKENVKWLFLFADCFLVQQSKDILYEIYERHYITEQIFHEMAGEIIKDKAESEAILEILGHLRFIRNQEEEIIITETGSAYCTYLERINQK